MTIVFDLYLQQPVWIVFWGVVEWSIVRLGLIEDSSSQPVLERTRTLLLYPSVLSPLRSRVRCCNNFRPLMILRSGCLSSFAPEKKNGLRWIYCKLNIVAFSWGHCWLYVYLNSSWVHFFHDVIHSCPCSSILLTTKPPCFIVYMSG